MISAICNKDTPFNLTATLAVSSLFVGIFAILAQQNILDLRSLGSLGRGITIIVTSCAGIGCPCLELRICVFKKNKKEQEVVSLRLSNCVTRGVLVLGILTLLAQENIFNLQNTLSAKAVNFLTGCSGGIFLLSLVVFYRKFREAAPQPIVSTPSGALAVAAPTAVIDAGGSSVLGVVPSSAVSSAAASSGSAAALSSPSGSGSAAGVVPSAASPSVLLTPSGSALTPQPGSSLVVGTAAPSSAAALSSQSGSSAIASSSAPASAAPSASVAALSSPSGSSSTGGFVLSAASASVPVSNSSSGSAPTLQTGSSLVVGTAAPSSAAARSSQSGSSPVFSSSAPSASIGSSSVAGVVPLAASASVPLSAAGPIAALPDARLASAAFVASGVSFSSLPPGVLMPAFASSRVIRAGEAWWLKDRIRTPTFVPQKYCMLNLCDPVTPTADKILLRLEIRGCGIPQGIPLLTSRRLLFTDVVKKILIHHDINHDAVDVRTDGITDSLTIDEAINKERGEVFSSSTWRSSHFLGTIISASVHSPDETYDTYPQTRQIKITIIPHIKSPLYSKPKDERMTSLLGKLVLLFQSSFRQCVNEKVIRPLAKERCSLLSQKILYHGHATRAPMAKFVANHSVPYNLLIGSGAYLAESPTLAALYAFPRSATPADFPTGNILRIKVTPTNLAEITDFSKWITICQEPLFLNLTAFLSQNLILEERGSYDDMSVWDISSALITRLFQQEGYDGAFYDATGKNCTVAMRVSRRIPDIDPSTLVMFDVDKVQILEGFIEPPQIKFGEFTLSAVREWQSRLSR